MTRIIHSAKSFRKDYKRLSKDDVKATDTVIQKLQKDEVLEQSYRDHELTGNYTGYRECHIKSDLLLVYKKSDDGEIHLLYLARISSHTNVFDISKRK